MKRIIDIFISIFVLVITLPLSVIAAIGVKLTSYGPIIYTAKRIGLNEKEFEMYKFRTMHASKNGSVITGANDPRIFGFGNFLRKTKIDELPQFINVILGDMTIVGPRPEDPFIVKNTYTTWMMETLGVRPGITSPGAIYYYACGEHLVDKLNPEESYIEKLLPPKIALDRAYIDRANIFSDFVEIGRTGFAIIGHIMGFKVLPAKQDVKKAKENWSDIPLETLARKYSKSGF